MEARPEGHWSTENEAGCLSGTWTVDAANRASVRSSYDLTNLDLRFLVRLNRFLAAAGLGSRRHCDELVAAGRVTVNGKVCTNFSAQPGARDHVKVDGKLVHPAPGLTIMLNKPAGFVSTRKDLHARNNVFDLIPEKFSHLFTIWRLDAQTQGLLL